MLGAIIGDIIGSRWEFNPTNDYNFELFSDKNNYTDDTICTIAVTDAILHGADDYGSFIHNWCRKYPHPMGGYGGSFAKWICNDNPQPYNSFGNGSAMRVSPVGWWFDDIEKISEHAIMSAECTHNHEYGMIGAVAVATAIHDCRLLKMKFKGKHIPKNDILEEGLANAIKFYEQNPEDFYVNIEKYRNKFDETCQGTVPVALWIVLNSKDFEDAIRQAVSLGADADTLGAITGSIAEALWGIPEWMKKKALSYLPEEMKKILRKFRKELEKKYEEDKEIEKMKEFEAVMRWKLGLGNFNKAMFGESPLPDKSKIATAEDWQIEPMPDNPNETSSMPLNLAISADMIEIIRKGHIPESQEDHWFIYCDEEYIRYYRSWTGMCAFEAHYKKSDEEYIIDNIIINHALAQFGVNGDIPGVALFRYLITAEAELDKNGAWQDYIDAWEFAVKKYSK